MSLQTHLAELTERHKSLDRKIAEQLAQPSANDAEIARLKLEKLKLKDRISQIKI